MEIVTAFSRAEKNSKGGKCYVQDRIEERDEAVIRLLMESNTCLYICGSASMARDVAARLGECIRKRLGWNEAELREWSESMRKAHKWQEDVWG
jgi:NADPH-ferrihemoprotein reductase